MLCVNEAGHPSDPVFGGHHLVAKRYVNSDEAWTEQQVASFLTQSSEKDNDD